MATYSNVLAWRTPGTGEPGVAQSQTRLKQLSSSSSSRSEFSLSIYIPPKCSLALGVDVRCPSSQQTCP